MTETQQTLEDLDKALQATDSVWGLESLFPLFKAGIHNATNRIRALEAKESAPAAEQKG